MKVLIVVGLCILKLNLTYSQTVESHRIVRIPVIFHVIHSDRVERDFEKGQNPDQNLPTELLLKELKDLHDDFLLLNKDTAKVLAIYKDRMANPEIDFFLGAIPGSYLPSSKPWEMEDQDAVSLQYKWIGQSYRLLTHEVGHWLGLLHLWGTGTAFGDKDSCPVGDDINDTPAQIEATDTTAACDDCPPPFGELTEKRCDPGVPTMFNNFMDYSGCRKMFTRDQVIEMRKNLHHNRKEMWDAGYGI